MLTHNLYTNVLSILMHDVITLPEGVTIKFCILVFDDNEKVNIMSGFTQA